MPTPSSDRSDPQPPRSYHPFSTCPEIDEPINTSPSSSTSQQRSHTPSSWHPRPPPPLYAHPDDGEEGLAVATESDGEAEVSSSPSVSPQSRAAGHDRVPDGPVQDEMLPDAADDSVDGHKPSDMDDDVLAIQDVELGIRGARIAVIQDGPSIGFEDRQSVNGGRSSRRRRENASSDTVATADESARVGSQRWVEDTGMLGLGYEFADRRMVPLVPSSYLRPGSRFQGTQQSERQRYEVQVEIKHVDLRESFLCGYLRIQGLTEDHPTLTTYFEGEIIGPKYGFYTQHPSWGASDKIDLSHWAKFTAFRPYAKQARKSGGLLANGTLVREIAQRENIFMRWKEHFLVPNHRVRTINGASFEGFYYICFNHVRGEISGIYFHSKSEKFQQLELKHVEDRGCHGAVEFR